MSIGIRFASYARLGPFDFAQGRLRGRPSPHGPMPIITSRASLQTHRTWARTSSGLRQRMLGSGKYLLLDRQACPTLAAGRDDTDETESHPQSDKALRICRDSLWGSASCFV